MGAPYLVTLLAEDRNARARVLLDIEDGGFVVLLDGRKVAYSEDAEEAMTAYRAIFRAVQRSGEHL